MATVKRRRKKKSAAPIVAVLLLIAAAIGAFVFIYTHYNIAMGTLFPKGEPIDLRGKSVSVRQYGEIARRHPDVTVYWDIPIGGARYDCTSDAIAVGNFSEKEVENFSLFFALHSVDARAADCYDEIRSLAGACPYPVVFRNTVLNM